MGNVMQFEKKPIPQYEYILTMDEEEKDWLWGLLAEVTDKQLMTDWDYEPRAFITSLKDKLK
jgi:starvation-inducible outer membrane lipoprotein